MDKQQAKEILLYYRPGRADEREPEVAAALELAQKDQDLAGWLRQHCDVQEALHTHFKEIPIPDGLFEQIVSERKARLSGPVRRKAMVLALASVCLLLVIAAISISLFRDREDRTFANFRSRMVRLVSRGYPRMDLETNDLAAVQQYLAKHQAPADYQLPGQLQHTPATGCAILPWQGKPVTMICFASGKAPKPNQPDLFLFVAERGDIPNPPSSAQPQFSQANRLATASWTIGDKTYLLAGLGDEDFLRRYW